MVVKQLPFDIFISKYFLKPRESAEKQFADYFFNGGENFKEKETRFFKLRTGEANWKTPGFGKLPDNLDSFPNYWVMPWANKLRKPLGFVEKFKRRMLFWKLKSEFLKLAANIKNKGFDNSKHPIKGFLLENSNKEQRFIYTDGNRRLGILASLKEKNLDSNQHTEITIVESDFISRNTIFDHPIVKKHIKQGLFTKEDTLRWFDNAFF